jgi:hypothetical protein
VLKLFFYYLNVQVVYLNLNIEKGVRGEINGKNEKAY